VPLLGGVIGYATNRLAVKMIFRPIRPIRIGGRRFGFRVQGLIGRRQADLAASIGRVVGSHLVRHEDVVQVLAGLDLEAFAGRMIERGVGPKVEELRRLPLVGSFLTDARVGDLQAALVRGVVEQRGSLVLEVEKALEEGLDVQAIVERKVAAFPVERLEALVLEVAARELRWIEVLGGVLGLLIGLLQVAVLALV
jgi:uncharacterized membrane protein YheB (UPF0754 family)